MRHAINRRLAMSWLAALPLAAGAEPSPAVSKEDAEQVRQVVRAQLDAFAADDAQAAFSYASPGIRAQLGSAERFLAMVKQGYPMVYRPAAVSFLEPTLIDGVLAQGVRMADADGMVWLVVYRLQRQPDKAWRIHGCEVVRRFGQTI